MYEGNSGSGRKMESAGQRMKSLFQATRGRRLDKQTGGGDIDWNLDLMSMKVEELKEREDESRQDGRGLTGLGIRVVSQKEVYSPFKHERRHFPSKGRQDDLGDDSDTISVTSTCPDIDLTPIVDAFPAPPTPTSSSESPSFPSSSPTLYPPSSSISSLPARPRSPPQTLTFDYHPQLQHRPSISTISSELTLASTISTNSSVETPSPQTPNTSEVLPAAIPRPNAANLRRVRSFAKPVSVYFSPDRPPALPLPILPPASGSPSASSPSLVVPSSPSASSPTIPSPRRISSVLYGFYAPAYGRVPQRPPMAPPDRPLPLIPPLDSSAPRDSRLISFPASPTRGPHSPRKRSIQIPALAQAQASRNSPSPPVVPPKDTPRQVTRPRSSSTGSESRTPTLNPRQHYSTERQIPSFEGYSLTNPTSRSQAQPRQTRLESTTSIASLDIHNISEELDKLASQSQTQTESSLSPTTTERAVSPAIQQMQEEKEKERERVRRLISRVSSVIEMRKLSTASSATCTSTGSFERERNGYKAYKLARKPSLSPSPSFAGQLETQSPRSRSSSIDSLESSASEELFDLSFESSHLSPPTSSIATSPSSTRYSRLPPRWSGRRRSSATTIEEESSDDRLKRSATRRADEMFGRVHEEEEEELRDQREMDHEEEEKVDDDATPRALRSYTSSESVKNRFESPRTLRTASSVPLLRNSFTTSPTISRRPSYSTGPRSPALKPLFTSTSLEVRRSYLPTPSPSLGSPSLRSPIQHTPPSSPLADPITSKTSTPRQFSSSNRKSSLPTPCSLPQPTFVSRRPSAPPDQSTQHHRRKSSLHTLTYKHSPLSSPAGSPTQTRSFSTQDSRIALTPCSIPRR